uniref:Uncharacterized protein n=1 Tax=Knipowitschia caucasica TaxID=637954 RepID=A0AAV2LRT3_KNICA
MMMPFVAKPPQLKCVWEGEGERGGREGGDQGSSCAERSSQLTLPSLDHSSLSTTHSWPSPTRTTSTTPRQWRAATTPVASHRSPVPGEFYSEEHAVPTPLPRLPPRSSPRSSCSLLAALTSYTSLLSSSFLGSLPRRSPRSSLRSSPRSSPRSLSCPSEITRGPGGEVPRQLPEGRAASIAAAWPLLRPVPHTPHPLKSLRSPRHSPGSPPLSEKHALPCSPCSTERYVTETEDPRLK